MPKWLGRCAACGAWNSLVEEPTVARSQSSASTPSRLVPISEVASHPQERVSTRLSALDTLLGGGLVRGSVVLVAGEPGVGKSTIVSQAAMGLCEAGAVVYVSAEESPAQVALRMARLGGVPPNLLVTDETRVEEMETHLLQGHVAIVDSIQTARTGVIESAPGSVSQVRESAGRLQRIAKENGISILLIGHVTKEGAIAGPRVLEHLVDVVLYFEGERGVPYRVLRATKNRFGATDEVALFEMVETGLRAVENPSAALLAERLEGTPGSAVMPVMEGSRCLLAEVQALCAPSFLTNPRRVFTGVDYNRMTIVIAVMEKRLGFRMGGQDVFVNIAGGLRVEEPAADLCALLAAVSSIRDVALPSDLVAFGEVGLAGELRSVGHADRRLKEAARMGFRTVLIPNVQKVGSDSGLRVIRAADVRSAVKAILPASDG